MTTIADIQLLNTAPTADIIGPYSTWPRKRTFRWKRPVALTGVVSAAGIFAHCIVPMIA